MKQTVQILVFTALIARSMPLQFAVAQETSSQSTGADDVAVDTSDDTDLTLCLCSFSYNDEPCVTRCERTGGPGAFASLPQIWQAIGLTTDIDVTAAIAENPDILAKVFNIDIPEEASQAELENYREGLESLRVEVVENYREKLDQLFATGDIDLQKYNENLGNYFVGIEKYREGIDVYKNITNQLNRQEFRG